MFSCTSLVALVCWYLAWLPLDHEDGDSRFLRNVVKTSIALQGVTPQKLALFMHECIRIFLMRFLLSLVRLLADSSSGCKWDHSGAASKWRHNEWLAEKSLIRNWFEVVEGGGGHVRVADDRVLQRDAYRRDCNAPSLSSESHTYEWHGFQSSTNRNPFCSPNSNTFLIELKFHFLDGYLILLYFDREDGGSTVFRNVR
jgi:hypothetical protein